MTGTDLVSDRADKWIKEILSKQKYDITEVKITGSSEKGEGYMGDIIFATVHFAKNGENGVLDIVVKSGKISASLREKFPVQVAFEREVFMYTYIISIFQSLETECQVDYLSKFLPKTYGTLLRDGEEVVILQNLKAAGYELHDRFQPLNIDHLKLTLDNYGKFHALGMAFKHKNPAVFQDKIASLPCLAKGFLEGMVNLLQVAEKTMLSILEEAEESYLTEKLRKMFPNGYLKEYKEILDVGEENCTLIHGDCWNNNYMFKYIDSEQTKPESVAFLDFQMIKAGSPVLDLSYHIYSTSSGAELEQFDVLLETYYQSLAKSLEELDCNPEEVFPFSELRRQWNVFSTMGFLTGTCAILLTLSNQEDVLEIENIDQKDGFDRLGQLNEKSHDIIAPRYLAIAKHFVNHRFE